MQMQLDINGRKIAVDAPPEMPLLWVLRDQLGMTGTKFGCGAAQCGACTIHLDGQPVRACQTPVEAAVGTKIDTIEGIADKFAAAIRASWIKLDVPQCGYCQSGQIMSAVALLRDNPKPSDADIDAAMQGNLCRCATYQRIRAAIHDAVKSLA